MILSYYADKFYRSTRVISRENLRLLKIEKKGQHSDMLPFCISESGLSVYYLHVYLLVSAPM
jgi:hypothetical protein